MAASFAAYLATLPAPRRASLEAVAATVRRHLPAGYVEAFDGRMLTWAVPLTRYPDTYNGQPLMYAALAAQTSHLALYLMAVYADPALDAWLRKAWAATGRRLDLGKSCLRFKDVADLDLGIVGQVIARVPVATHISRYEATMASARAARATAKPKATATPKAPAKASAKATPKPRATPPRSTRR